MAYNIRLGLTVITLLPRDHYRTCILIASIIVVTDRRSMLLKHIMYIYTKVVLICLLDFGIFPSQKPKVCVHTQYR